MKLCGPVRQTVIVSRITLVCDNLNTHAMGSLYAAFPAVETYRNMSKLDLVYNSMASRQKGKPKRHRLAILN
jgi:hypothetical protein